MYQPSTKQMGKGGAQTEYKASEMLSQVRGKVRWNAREADTKVSSGLDSRKPHRRKVGYFDSEAKPSTWYCTMKQSKAKQSKTEQTRAK